MTSHGGLAPPDDGRGRQRSGNARVRTAATRRRAAALAVALLAAAVAVAAAQTWGGKGDGARPSAAAAQTEGAAAPAPASSTLHAVATSASAAVSTSAPAERQVTIAAVGDLELGNTPVLPKDPGHYLSPVRSALAAPIGFGNLEGTLTDGIPPKCATPTPTTTTQAASGTTATASRSASAPSSSPPPSHDCYAFRVPPSYARILRQAGFTVLSSANNHSHDVGARGITDTTAVLRAAGVAQTGLPGQLAIVKSDGVTVAFVGFAPYSVTNNLLDLDAARGLIATAKQKADVVVVYMHAGAEGTAAEHVTGDEEWYLGEDRGNAEAFAHAAIDAGADLVVGSGPHVLRGMGYYRGHLIAYSLGNFAGYWNFATTGALKLSGILRVTLAADGQLVGAAFTSLILDAAGRPAIDPSHAAAKLVNQLSVADFGADAAVVQVSGAISTSR